MLLLGVMVVDGTGQWDAGSSDDIPRRGRGRPPPRSAAPCRRRYSRLLRYRYSHGIDVGRGEAFLRDALIGGGGGGGSINCFHASKEDCTVKTPIQRELEFRYSRSY